MLFIYDILNDIIETSIEKIDVHSIIYQKYEKDAQEKENQLKHFYENFCLKKINRNSVLPRTIQKSYSLIENKILTLENDLLKKNLKKLCVLEKNHKGKCISDTNIFEYLFQKDEISDLSMNIQNLNSDANLTYEKIIKILKNKFDLCVFSTPGNDDYIFKNRSNRLFPIALSKIQERKIRDTEKELKCAIPLCEHTTPFGLASAFIDLLTFTISIKDIEIYLNKSTKLYQILMQHKINLENYWKKYNIKIFNNGYLIKPLKKNNELISIINFKVDKYERNNKDIEMGHATPRKDGILNIRGFNLLFMTRRENLILGDNELRETLWKDDLKNYL